MWWRTEFGMTKDALYRKIRGIADKAMLCRPLVEHDYLLRYFRHHPDATRKLNGVRHFEIRLNSHYKESTGFWVVRSDGSEDISAKIVLYPRSDEPKAARQEIQNQIDEFRVRVPKERCGICGEYIEGAGEVDHVSQFSDLLREFKETYEVEIELEEQGSFGTRFKNRDLARLWFDFHSRHPLQWSHPDCNRRK